MTGVLIPTATVAEWLEARRHGVTASEIAVIMGLSPWSSPYALFWRKLGELPEQDDSDAMALGRYLESYVLDRFEDRHPEFVVAAGGQHLYSHPDRPWQMATPDAMLHEADLSHMPTRHGPMVTSIYPVAVLEAKTDASHDGWGEDGTDGIPVRYRCQVLWQCDVLGVDHWYLACLFLHSRKLRVYEGVIDADAEADLKIMRDTAQCFLDDIRDGNPPDVDWRPATTTALKRLHPSVEDRDAHIGRRLEISYRAAIRRHKEAEKRKQLMENRLRDAMGSARRAVAAYGSGPGGGLLIARRDVYDLPEKTITRKAATVDRLVAVKPKDQP
jgi:putative phage-type endonuclease